MRRDHASERAISCRHHGMLAVPSGASSQRTMHLNACPAAVTMSDEVTAFLRQGGLERYGRILVEGGFDTMDLLALMDGGDMIELEIKRCYEGSFEIRTEECETWVEWVGE